jgi:hypothetical protein
MGTGRSDPPTRWHDLVPGRNFFKDIPGNVIKQSTIRWIHSIFIIGYYIS